MKRQEQEKVRGWGRDNSILSFEVKVTRQREHTGDMSKVKNLGQLCVFFLEFELSVRMKRQQEWNV